jgi:hypothetical protein
MSKNFLLMFAAGLGIIAIAVGAVFYAQRGEHLSPQGSVVKVRTQEMEDKRSMVVLDVRLINDSDVAMTVRAIEITVETPDGNSAEGISLSAADMRNVLKDYPLLGEQFTEPLSLRGKIPPRSTVDRMLAAAFETKIADVEGRRQIKVKVEGEDGTVLEFSGK